MKEALPDEMILRRYLLGQLDVSSELADELHDRLLSDEGLSEMVGVIEDEIIEDYLEGALDPADQQAVEEHFLRPPERQKKLRVARQLQWHLKAVPDKSAQRWRGTQATGPVARWYSQFRTYAEIAAGLVVIVAGTFYLSSLRQGFQAGIGKNQHELTNERDRSAMLAQQVRGLRALQQPSTVMLNLLKPGIERGNGQLPEVEIGSGTQRIHVEIVLQGGVPGPYDVRLEASDGKLLWSQSHLQPFKSSDIALLTFDVPLQAMESGHYRFVIQPPTALDHQVFYSFNVKRVL